MVQQTMFYAQAWMKYCSLVLKLPFISWMIRLVGFLLALLRCGNLVYILNAGDWKWNKKGFMGIINMLVIALSEL